VKQKLPPINI